jgi:phosphoribosylanthranilate isomerase
MTLVKICGITSLADARVAIDAGADALGFNFYRPSPRYISPETVREITDQLPQSILRVGVFVNEDVESVVRIIAEANLSAVQLHGDESPEYCHKLAGQYVIKVFRAGDDFDSGAYPVDAIMLDTKDDLLRGGTGRVFDWSIAQRTNNSAPKLFLAGGLSPENVVDAIVTVRPYAVDACSSLEERPGRKNHARVRAFVEAARSVKP